MHGYTESDVMTLFGPEDYKKLKGHSYWLGQSKERVIEHADNDDDSFLFTVGTDPTSEGTDEDRPTFYAIIKQDA